MAQLLIMVVYSSKGYLRTNAESRSTRRTTQSKDALPLKVKETIIACLIRRRRTSYAQPNSKIDYRSLLRVWTCPSTEEARMNKQAFLSNLKYMCVCQYVVTLQLLPD